jgi:glutamate/aspartate transport system ATP-binding protein
MIEIKNVSKWYGPVQVLNDCSVNINKGDVVVVCGPSGSGKSTLIKTVNGLEPIQKGTISVDGIGSTIPRPTCPSCAAASAWCSSTSSCSRTCRSPRTSPSRR